VVLSEVVLWCLPGAIPGSLESLESRDYFFGRQEFGGGADPMKVVITGGTSGIGRAVAAHLAQEGMDVVCICRDPAKGAGLPHNVTFLKADLSNRHDILRVLGQIEGWVDVLINNAGIPPTRKAATGWRGLNRMVAVCLVAPYLLSTTLLRRKSVGRIINVCSVQHHTGNAITSTGQTSYADAKFSLMCLSLRLRELHPEATVVAVNPGYVDTGIWHPRAPLERWHAPVRRVLALTPAEVVPLFVTAIRAPDGEAMLYLTPYDTPWWVRRLRACLPAAMLLHDVVGRHAWWAPEGRPAEVNPACWAQAAAAWRFLRSLRSLRSLR
jgi:3-oxoacyl-[acyl-carrier protein] reductase